MRGWATYGAATVGVAILIGLARLPFEQLHERKAVQSARDQSGRTWQTMIDARYPASQNEIVFEQTNGTDSKVIFTRRFMDINGYRGLSLAGDAFSRESRQWEHTSGYAFAPDYTLKIGDPISAQAVPQLTAVWLEFKPRSFYFGVSFDPRISRIRIVDEQNRAVAETTAIKRDSDGYAYWILAMAKTGFHGSGLTVQGLDASGSLLATNVSS
ncbi:hypothetical protein [Paenibacillus glycinis]|uniref:Uncharacterized protein n=1 Tax=Paenibacillus glycinis TaxID=2697035 RepID=A0ABW9XP31_9BACL|nr:hypothetical protein [Paenibacillus glycinis]NBD24191.1 hypothetical protein [Paenibacillus glycinis]